MHMGISHESIAKSKKTNEETENIKNENKKYRKIRWSMANACQQVLEGPGCFIVAIFEGLSRIK